MLTNSFNLAIAFKRVSNAPGGQTRKTIATSEKHRIVFHLPKFENEKRSI